jgi:deazaflavin-dependent oxidoreductase (nitroreductase family)
MNEKVRKALEHGHAIDITTTGRKSGQPRRIEIAFYNLDGRLYIWGRTPSHRDWFANLQINPEFKFHLKQSVQADLQARARIVVDNTERREIFSKLIQLSESKSDLEAVIEGSPLVEITIEPD